MFFCQRRLYRLPFNNEPPQIVGATHLITTDSRYALLTQQKLKRMKLKITFLTYHIFQVYHSTVEGVNLYQLQ